MVKIPSLWFTFLVSIAYAPFFCCSKSWKNIEISSLYKRAFEQDCIIHNASKAQQASESHSVATDTQRKKRKWGVIRPVTEEQKQAYKQRVKEYKRTQSFKGLKE